MSRKRRRNQEQRPSLPDIRGFAHREPVVHRPEYWAEARRCWDNVQRKILLSGGSLVAGYLLTEPITPELKATAFKLVAHCVWRSPAGQLIDVTPHHLEEIDFFADAAATTTPSAIQPLPGLKPAELQEVYRLAQKELEEDRIERIESTNAYCQRAPVVCDGQHRTTTA